MGVVERVEGPIEMTKLTVKQNGQPIREFVVDPSDAPLVKRVFEAAEELSDEEFGKVMDEVERAVIDERKREAP